MFVVMGVYHCTMGKGFHVYSYENRGKLQRWYFHVTGCYVPLRPLFNPECRTPRRLCLWNSLWQKSSLCFFFIIIILLSLTSHSSILELRKAPQAKWSDQGKPRLICHDLMTRHKEPDARGALELKGRRLEINHIAVRFSPSPWLRLKGFAILALHPAGISRLSGWALCRKRKVWDESVDLWMLPLILLFSLLMCLSWLALAFSGRGR